MRIFLVALITILGANVFISVLNAQSLNTMKERNAAIEALLKPPSNIIQ